MADDIPTDSEFQEILNSQDLLSKIIKGHQCIESVLNLAISEFLPEPHVLEIRRLNFSLKVDLATALRIIDSESRITYHKINKLRNDFAHNFNADIKTNKVRELFNALSPFLKHLVGKEYDEIENDLERVEYVLAVVFVQLQGAVTNIRDRKAEDLILHEMVVKVLGNKINADSDKSQEVQQKIKLARDQRKSEGRL